MEEKKQINKIFIECTQAQFDALSDEEKENDSLYSIKEDYDSITRKETEK